MSWLEAAARWYGIIALCTWAFLPLVRWLCAALSDRGVTIARPIALLLAIYPAWLLASLGLLPYGNTVLIAIILLVALGGWGWAARLGGMGRELSGYVVWAEVAALGLFLVYLWLRGFTPEILGTEKPMDVAFLASSARTVTMPPPDPWFAGEPINYYYLGYLLHGSIGRLAGVPAEIGFNLALATIFSMTGMAAFGVAWNAVRPWLGRKAGIAAGLLGTFFLLIAGNLYAPLRLLQNSAQTVDAWWWDSAAGIGWRASRIVCDGPREGNLCPFPATETINEFPFFSFLLGDLHPHLMALPYALVAVALAWNLANRVGNSSPGISRAWLVRLALTGGIVGALYALNAWDLPTFLILCLAGTLMGFSIGRSRREGLVAVVVLIVAAVAAWLPFVASYDAPFSEATRSGLPAWIENLPVLRTLGATFALYLGQRTSLDEYLTIFGVPYLIGILLLAMELMQRPAEERARSLRMAAMAAVATVLPGVLLSAPVLPLCGIPLALAVDRLLDSPTPSPRTFALAAFASAWFLSLCVELVYVRDLFDNRMNTLFKFYYQAWSLYALAAGVTIALLWTLTAPRSWPRLAMATLTTAAILAGLAYPVVASYQWTEGFGRWQGLDGLAYGDETAPGDVAAIRWLANQASPGDVILEAAGCSYYPFNRLPFDRVSAFSGVPTVIGWENHERQWRGGQPALLDQIATRQQDMATMFNDPRSPLFAAYGVRWMIVGDYEAGNWRSECEVAGPYPGIARPGYPGPGWEEAFRSGETRIYRRMGG